MCVVFFFSSVTFLRINDSELCNMGLFNGSRCNSLIVIG